MNKIEDKKTLTIKFESSLSHLTDYNKSFDSGILRVAYPGLNANNSYISKEVFDQCKNTIYNCPIVANYDVYEDEIGGHDVAFIKDNNGEVKIINVTEPLGCVPESAKIYWEEIQSGGELKEYLTTEVLLWKRQPCYKYIQEHEVTAHSMEITVIDGETIDGIFVVKQFEFSALCLLGENVMPCFEASALQTFNFDSFKNKFHEMMNEITLEHRSMAKKQQNFKEEDIIVKKLSQEQLALFDKYSIAEEDLNMEHDSIVAMSVEDLELHIQKTQKQNDFALNIMDLVHEIRDIVSKERLTDEYGWEYSRYMFIDIQDNEIIVADWKDNGNYYSFPFAENGDAITVDFEGKKRKKCKYEDFQEGEGEFVFSLSEVQAEKNAMSEKYATLDAEFKQYKDSTLELASANEQLQSEFNSLKDQYELLNQESVNKEKELHKQRANELFERFNLKLSGIEEFEVMKSEYEKFTLEELEKECFALFGKLNFNAKGKKEELGTKYILSQRSKSQNNEEPYGGLHSKYGIKNI